MRDALTHCLRGVLSDTPEEWFGRALEIARSQASKSLELCVAVSLGRLWKGELWRGPVRWLGQSTSGSRKGSKPRILSRHSTS